MLKDTPEAFQDKDSTGAPISDFYDTAVGVLCIFAPPWKRLKPLLLAFTEMTMPAVPADFPRLYPRGHTESLRSLFQPWPEAKRKSPLQPYCEIPLWVENAMGFHWVERASDQKYMDELDKDSHSYELREFVKSCLEQLGIKKNDINAKNRALHHTDDNMVLHWVERASDLLNQKYMDELEKDSHLYGLREEFARFCLERLETRKNDTKAKNRALYHTDDNFVEHRPLWRRYYVQALKALDVDLEGRTGETLLWLSENDPDKIV